jgi:hypothetical protein
MIAARVVSVIAMIVPIVTIVLRERDGRNREQRGG